MRRINNDQRVEQLWMRHRNPLRNRTAHRMPNEHDSRAKALDNPSHIFDIRRRSINRRPSPLAPPMPAKIERKHPSIRRQQRRNPVPPMRMRRATMQQQESSLGWIPAPIQIVQLKSRNLDIPMGRLRKYGSRLLLCHNQSSY